MLVPDMIAKSRKILMLSTDVQIDRRILLQADSLEEDGWNVTILAIHHGNVASISPDDSRVVRLGQDGVSPRKVSVLLSAYRILRRFLPMDGFLMRAARAFGWRFLVVQESFYLNMFLQDGLKNNADVVVSDDLPMLAVGRALADSFDAKLVYDSHELYCEQEISRSQRLRWERVERRYISSCDHVITVNSSIARELEKRYGIAGVAVIHNADRVEPLEVRSRYLHDYFDIPYEHYVLLLQGGFSEGRNLIVLVEGFSLVNTACIHLVFLGDGVLAEELRKRSVGALSGRLHIHQSVPQKDLLAITASADAGVIPYLATCLNNYYCTPNKLFEFIAAGLPVLGSDLPEIRRFIKGYSIGEVADFSSEHSIAGAIDDFFSDHLRLMGWKNRLLSVRQEVCWQKESEILKNIYRNL